MCGSTLIKRARGEAARSHLIGRSRVRPAERFGRRSGPKHLPYALVFNLRHTPRPSCSVPGGGERAGSSDSGTAHG